MTSIDSASTTTAGPVAAPPGGRRPPGADGEGRDATSRGGADGRGRPASGVLTGTMTDDQTTAASALSDLVGTGHDDLLAELRGGSDLLEMLQSRGITRSQASAAVGEGFLLDATT